MKNKYKEELSKFKVSNKVKERIYTKIEQPQIKRFKLSYGIIALLLTCLISIGIVYAEDIKNLIESWGKTKITFYKKGGEKESVELSEIKTIRTKLDDFVFDDKVYSKLDIQDGFYPLPIEGVTKFSNLKLADIEDKIGINILGIRSFKYNYSYSEVTKDKKIGSIFVEMNDDYVVDCGATSKCNPLGKKYKGLNITADIRTQNAEEKNYILAEWGYSSNNAEDEHPNIKKFNKIGDLEVEGLSYIESILDKDGTNEEFLTDMMFNYENIRYNVTGWNLTHEEIIKILEENLK